MKNSKTINTNWSFVPQMPNGYTIEAGENNTIAMIGVNTDKVDPDEIDEIETLLVTKLIANAPNLLQAVIQCESITDRCNNAMLPQHIQELLKSLNNTLKEAINKLN